MYPNNPSIPTSSSKNSDFAVRPLSLYRNESHETAASNCSNNSNTSLSSPCLLSVAASDGGDGDGDGVARTSLSAEVPVRGREDNDDKDNHPFFHHIPGNDIGLTTTTATSSSSSSSTNRRRPTHRRTQAFFL